MRRLWPSFFIVFLIAVLVFGLRPLIVGPSRAVRILPVPEGDREIVWIHTSTNTANWERFVTGIHRIRGIQVDDSKAFPDLTTSIPEVVIQFPNQSQRILVRWYKLTSDISSQKIVDTLAERNPPPMAVVGGGSTDRALDLAQALERRREWKGPRPLLLLTLATANDVLLDEDLPSERGVLGIRKPRDLMKVYPGRTFRFCFTNQQMANAVVDFLWQQPTLKPSGTKEIPAPVFILAWDDDPYSLDLSEHFRKRLHDSGEPIRIVKDIVHHSVGTFHRPNRKEAEIVEQMLRDIPTKPGDRSLLVLPTVGPPARRVLKTLAGEFPRVGEHLVAVNGDGIPFNFFYRDGDFAWPARDIPIPFVFFMHQNPVAWDEPKTGPIAPGTLTTPNSTEDVLLYSELMDRVCRALERNGQLVGTPEELAKQLRDKFPGYFDEDGNRTPGSGEFIVWIKPQYVGKDRIAPQGTIELWTHEGKDWKRVRELER